MSFSPNDVENGIQDSISSLIDTHTSGAEITADFFDDLSGLNMDTDVASALQDHAASNSSFWDKIYLADPEEYTSDTIREVTLGTAANMLAAQENLTLRMTTDLILKTTYDYTIEEAFVKYVGDLPVSAYVEKTTGRIVVSEVVQSTTTHIPIGKYLVGLARATEAYLMYATFKNTIVDSYHATLGQEDTFTPAKDYLVATTGAVTGLAASSLAGGPETPIGGFVAGLVGGLAGWTADSLIGTLGNIIHDAKVDGKTLEETQAIARAAIRDAVNDSWSAEGSEAATGLTKAGEFNSDLLDSLKSIIPDAGTPVRDALPDPIVNEIQPAFANAITASSPLVIDLSSSHTGVTLTAWDSDSTTTFFDLNDNGFAVQTAWVSDDTGLLARDLDSNGRIDSTAELFGSPTVDGFANLAALDSNHDLRIDNNDVDWSTLVVWTDDNGDAVTESGELHSLASLGIASIDLAGVAASTSTISGNPISHTSSVTFTDGDTATIADAWFVHDNTNSYYTGAYTLDPEVLFLPTLRGYGTLPDFSVAMSLDSDLKNMVAEFVGGFTISDIADAATEITDILYKWAGVDGVSPASRGYEVDARHLEFLEHMLGTDFNQTTYGPDGANPRTDAAAYLEDAYQAAFKMFSADFLIQVGIGELFDSPLTYNPATGMPNGDMALSHDAIDDLAIVAPSTGPENEAFWVALAGTLDDIKGIDNLTVDEISWLGSAVTASNALLDWSDVLSAYYHDAGTSSANGTSGADILDGGNAADTIHGNAGDDVIHGGYGNDFIYGDDDDDILYGGEGHDYVLGGSGNDILYGENGNDQMFGGSGNDTYYAGAGGNYLTETDGNDTYVYGGGDDVISEYGGTDQIILPPGIVLGDLTFSRVSTSNSLIYFDDLLIQIEGSGSIQIQGHFQSPSFAIETLVFSDSSTVSLSSVAGADVRLTDGNDNYSGSGDASYAAYGFDGNDTIWANGTGDHILDGGNGNDILQGGTASNDTYIASAGFDQILENGGIDTIVIQAEYNTSDLSFYRIGTYDLGILISGLGQIQIVGQLSYTGGVENIHFLADNTTLSLTDMSVATIGTADNDYLYAPSAGASPNDLFDGREGDDHLYGGAGNDVYVFSAGHDTIDEGGSGGDDTIRVRDSYTPSDVSVFFDESQNLQVIDSDGNNITVYSQGYASGYGVEHISFGDSTTWNLGSMEIETHGTSGSDSLTGSDYGDASSDDTIYGYAGNDYLYGGGGADSLYGGDGNDTLRGEAGNDVIYGGDGDDDIYAGSLDGDDVAHGGAGADVMYGADHSILYGDDGNDSLYNNVSSAYATGALVTLYGGGGTDALYGGDGATIMDGGAGADTLYGGSGHNVFRFGADTSFDAVDTVQYFYKNDGDQIDISDILDGHFNPATDVITNFVQINDNAGNSEIYVDPAGSADFGASAHIATILSVTGLTDEESLVTSGTLLAA